MNLDPNILNFYKERKLYANANYEHMFEFEIKAKDYNSRFASITSFYMMDRQNRFWFAEKFLEHINIDYAQYPNKYFDVADNRQEKFYCFDDKDIFLSLFNENNSDSEFVSLFLPMLIVILDNHRQGTPRKNFIIGNKAYNIQMDKVPSTINYNRFFNLGDI